MAEALRQSNATVNAKCDARAALFDGGALRIYSGTQPATADTATGGGHTLLAELSFADPAFGAAVAGVAAANSLTADASANATGTATWYRCVTSGGATIEDGSVGTSSANLVLSSTSISAGVSVSVSAFTITEPKE